jgi:Fic family protein
MDFNRQKPHNSLPPLPPGVDIETREVLKKTVTAGRALAELKGLGGTIPDQSILVNSLILQEAKASSEIENIHTTNEALFLAFSADTSRIDPATKEVLRYREALWEGYRTLQRTQVLTTNLFISTYQVILNTRSGIRNVPGTTISNSTTGKVIYSPPEGEGLIRDKLGELEQFIHGPDSLDPLIKLALVHYQFEAIHPFPDGNGRVGRILNLLYLVHKGLIDFPILYLSKYVIEKRSAYNRLLRRVTEQDQWVPWILYMLDAVEETAKDTKERITGIRDLLEHTLALTRKELPSRVYSKELIELLFHRPFTKVQFLVDAGIAKRQTAAEYLKELEKIGVLKSHKAGKEMLYLNVRLYDLLAG